MGMLRKIAASALAVSEPHPRMFGNGPNEVGNKLWTNSNWLKSRFHFSFAEYYNPKNTQFGVLRVMNDDLVQPSRGFGTHPHANMEIVTYVVHGALTHEDSMGTCESLGRGSIQFMTAGTGVAHSEFNADPEKPLRFIQMWIVPRKRGLAPNYGSMVAETASSCLNTWSHLVADAAATASKSGADAPVKINQDVNIFVARLEKGKTLPLQVEPGRQAYFLQVEGSVTLTCAQESVELHQHDAAELCAESPAGASIVVEGRSDDAHCLVVEMAHDGKGGRFQ
mmetsp:Transcript_7213/g.19324  ORF Transcript_7213/g.19324 Transcript_7213/m.19324 type:complete len:281 (+) Transcript_7213:14-856(+)